MDSRKAQLTLILCLGWLPVVAILVTLGSLAQEPTAVQAGWSDAGAGTITDTLMTLYTSTDGANWTNSDGWGSGDSYCTWHGVACAYGDGMVTDINLSNNNLSGTLPAELGDLTSLEILSLINNNLSGPIPPELGNLTSLWELGLYNNSLTGSLPPELGNLSSLLWLYLDSNALTGAIPPQLGNLSNLQTLHLNNNNLSGRIPSELADLGNLLNLWLHNNPNLTCWETGAAWEWAVGLSDYNGPDSVCGVSLYLPAVMDAYSPLTNGGFEAGWAGWNRGGVLPQAIVTDNKYSGAYSARLGDPSFNCAGGVPVGPAWIEQTISVPSSGVSGLRIHYRIVSEDLFNDQAYDRFEILVNGAVKHRDGNQELPYGCIPDPHVGPWEYYDVDLTAYAGQNITLRLANWSWPDGNFNTWTYVDQIQFIP